MPTIQPKTPDIWVVGQSRMQELSMLLVVGAGLGSFGYLAVTWLGNRPAHWGWWLASVLVTVLGADWAFFEDRWVINRRSRMAFLCRPLRRTRAYAFQDFERMEQRNAGRRKVDAYFVAKDGSQVWIARGGTQEFRESVTALSQFMEITLAAEEANLSKPALAPSMER